MFEKEAEEYAKKVYGNSTEIDHYGIADAFKDGAEFGYNKANEWHYVKDGDLPKEEAEYLVIFESDGTRYIGIESYYPDTKEWSTICNIIAWKEIVFPEEDEIESEMFPEIILPKGSSEFIDKVIADAEKRIKEIE